MGGVETNAEPFRLADVLDDGGEMVELISETRALSRRGLERDLRFHFRNHRPDRVDRGTDLFQPRLFAGAEMRSRMQNEKRQFELSRPSQFFGQGTERVRMELRIRGGEIDQVTRVS